MNLFRRLEEIDTEADASSTYTGHTRWMIPYADLLTLLLGFFLVLFASSQVKAGEAAELAQKTPENSVQAAKDFQKLPNKTAVEQKEQVEPMASAASREGQTLETLQAKLESELDALGIRGVEVHRQERGLVISLKDSILFDPGKAEFSPQAKRTLDHLANQLKVGPHGLSRPIRVEGHTDNTPILTAQYPSNWELSTARATNIVRYLVTMHHLPAEKLSAAGYGEYKPVADNSSIEGKQKNRRVDIVVLSESTARQEPPVPFRE